MTKYLLRTTFVIVLLLVTSAASFSNRSSREGIANTTEAVNAQAPAAWPVIALEQVNIGNLASPVHLTNAGDGSGRIFIVERIGRIRLVKNGNLQATPFLDISNHVLSGGEQGLLSVAFPPDYAQRKQFYVYYTQGNGDNVVARFRTSANPDLADSASEQQILELPHPFQTNHNGGQLAFGPDGYLYIGPGDGGGGGDPYMNGQNPASLLGKILRIDVEGRIPFTTPNVAFKVYLPLISTNTGLLYSIPPDNPFVHQPGYRPEIWALGLRNPWRFSFDRLTGNLYIADVGQNAWEEVDFQPASSNGGENYGWNILEGSHCYSPSSGCVPPASYSAPVTEYPHGANNSNGCSITGGFVYRGAAYSDLQNIYFFADYCQGKIWGLKFENSAWQSQLLLDTALTPSSFGEDESGEVYVVSLSGQIYHLVSVPPAR
jgi:glucose/arabinose dehydrogenase